MTEAMIKTLTQIAKDDMQSILEIADALGHASNWSVRKHIENLVKYGYVRKLPGLARRINITTKGREFLSTNKLTNELPKS